MNFQPTSFFSILSVVIPIIMIVMGIVGIIFPRVAWYFSEGWKFKNVEPSELALLLIRVGGGFIIVFSFIVFSILKTFSHSTHFRLP
jgi:hypothetical protein